MHVDIPAADDPRVYLTFEIPVKGHKPLLLKVPRFDFMPEPEFDAMSDAMKAVTDDPAEMTGRKRNRLTVLAMLKPFVTEQQYAACQQLVPGQLDRIAEVWRDSSVISLGEYIASNGSSPSTERPSTTTSSPADSAAETSDPS